MVRLNRADVPLKRIAKVVLEKLETIAEQVGSVSNVFPIANRISIDDYLDAANEDAAAQQAGEAFDHTAAETERDLHTQVWLLQSRN